MRPTCRPSPRRSVSRRSPSPPPGRNPPPSRSRPSPLRTGLHDRALPAPPPDPRNPETSDPAAAQRGLVLVDVKERRVAYRNPNSTAFSASGNSGDGDRYVTNEAVFKAVDGHEPEVLKAIGIDWPGGSKHITCPYPGHDDKHPSWRWDDQD